MKNMKKSRTEKGSQQREPFSCQGGERKTVESAGDFSAGRLGEADLTSLTVADTLEKGSRAIAEPAENGRDQTAWESRHRGAELA
jgi:hypothetical protein